MKTTSLFTNGRCQAVRLPAEFAFKDRERVYVRRDANGDVVLSAKPRNFDRFLALLDQGGTELQITRDRHPATRDPFEDWSE